MLHHLDYINKLLQHYYPNVLQPPYQNSISAIAWNSWKAIWTVCIEPDQVALQNKETQNPENKRPNDVRVVSVVIPHQEEENAKGLSSAATETFSEADAVLEEKGEKKEINELENGRQSTYHSKWHDTNGRDMHSTAKADFIFLHCSAE